jgi:nitrate reductase / nitrite oxidoreductase, alpha subunit
MSQYDILKALRFFRPKAPHTNCKEEAFAENLAEVRCGLREWEDFYRRRWQYDKKVRSTHGVNCTGSCSWDVFVKNGVIVWELQRGDYPGCGPDSPDHEPRGCPRGATFSWYTYSPIRVKYPYVRSSLLKMWREALEAQALASAGRPNAANPEPDPVAAWRSVVEDPEKRKKYQQARGKGGFVRVSRKEALTLIASSLIYTIKKYGPDRIFGHSPIPAMSMVGYSSGARFLTLIGGSMVSFYDWYSDLPPASPQIWGDQTDVPESADWYQSTYIIVWGSNIPMTRTPDAHFYTEVRYRGAKVAAVSPDYAEYVKFADCWLPAKPGTDAALAMAMTHVVVKEFYIERQSEYFTSYAKLYTDLPFAVVLKKQGDHYVSERFLRASDLNLDLKNPDWKTLYFDSTSGRFCVPNGSVGFRWSEESRWNLNPINSQDDSTVDPTLSFAQDNDGWLDVSFPLFDFKGAHTRRGAVPAKKIQSDAGEILVTTVFDLLVAHLGIDRGAGGDVAESYDGSAAFSPAWQEEITGVPKADAIRVAREFAENAEKTRGKSMILLGSGANHWYHSDTIYRSIINLTTLCGCQGVNGGGWAHYTGQEKVRPMAAWSAVAFAKDWVRPARQQNATSFYYFASEQWRYETMDVRDFAPPHMEPPSHSHPADYNCLAVRRGWMPFYPQFDKNSLELLKEAVEKGAVSDGEIVSYVVEQLKKGDLKFAIEDVDSPNNFPRVFFCWRANVLGASAKGHEYFLKHMLGTHHSVLGSESDVKTQEVLWRDSAPEGKLDLMVTLDFRMSTNALYSDVVLPAATWYEIHDLSTTDMHPFIHPFTPAIDPPWETMTDWEHYRELAKIFSELAEKHLPECKDIVASPLLHDTPGEIGQPKVKDWTKGEVEPIPGSTMPNLTVVSRDYPNVYKMMTALGPLIENLPIGAKGVTWNAKPEYDLLRKELGAVKEQGVALGMPKLYNNKDVAETILALAPETNGAVAVRGWGAVEKRSGLALSQLSKGREAERFTFAQITARPQKIITSPVWSGKESEGRTYSAFVINVEEKLPFHTLTGRAHIYLDHEWMLQFGESLPIFRPPFFQKDFGLNDVREPKREILLRYLTPHSKWSIHSAYSDGLIMLTLFRGGKAIWINNEDAESIGVADNDWLECFNTNGVVTARAVVTHRVPRGTAMMYHAQERTVDSPGSRISENSRGTHNSVTRILVKPTHLIGGYAQLSYDFNYYGPTGCQRDSVIIVRKAEEVNWYED